MWRMVSNQRGYPLSMDIERLAFKHVEAGLRLENEARGLANLQAFKAFQASNAEQMLSYFDQPVVLNENETIGQLEELSAHSAGSGPVWSFMG